MRRWVGESRVDPDAVIKAVEHARSQGGTLVEVSSSLLGNILTLLRPQPQDVAEVWEPALRNTDRGAFDPPPKTPTALDALHELVAVKAIKERIEFLANLPEKHAERAQLQIEYGKRQPRAWEAAREVLAAVVLGHCKNCNDDRWIPAGSDHGMGGPAGEGIGYACADCNPHGRLPYRWKP